MGGITTTLFQRPRDPQFNNTTLLLSGNFPTNGAQNNTFLDSSSNGFSITRNGNTTQGSFSPFSLQPGQWSNYFNGSSYLTAAANSGFSLAGDFTIEMWINPASLSTANSIIIIESAAASGLYLAINAGTSTVNIFLNSSASSFTATPVGGIALNTWTHVALVRSGSTITLYVNGVAASGTGSSAATLGSSTTPFRIGGFTGSYTGYISNLRVVNGRAVYTSNFTPSPSPLTATSGGQNPPTGTQTTLLTCQANRFVDAGGLVTPITISVAGGTPSVQAFSPFVPSGAYTTTAVGGSGYFDGAGDYLSVGDNSILRLGTSAFTIQAWIYRSVAGTAHSIIAKGGASTGFVLQVTSTNVLRFTHTTTNIDTTTTIPAGAWTHVAAVRTSTSTNGFQLYINGVSSATSTVATDFSQTDTLYVGADRSAANVMNGYISGLKYTNGTAETISVPTAPPTATTNVQLLLNFTNAGIFDSTAKNDVETGGNAQISTTQWRFGGTSMFFDGTGDYIQFQDGPNPNFALGSGDWTIEFWIRLNTTGVAQTVMDIADGNAAGRILLQVGTSQQIQFLGASGGNRTTSSLNVLSLNTWAHVAICKASGSTRIFVDGAQVNTTYSDTNTYTCTTGNVVIGINENLSSSPLNAYLDDFRITKAARYTANFNVPTIGFTDR